MSAEVTQIIKEGSNVLLKDAAGNILKILNSQEIYAHPSAAPADNIIQFNNSPDRCAGNDSFFILVDNITLPAGPWTQQTLLQELSNGYINCPTIVDATGNLLQLLTDLLACCVAIDGNTDQIEAKLDQQIALLTSLDGKVATETTLAAVLADTTTIIAQLTTLNGKDFATQTTLDALLIAFNAEDFATEATQVAIKLQTDKLTFTGPDLNVKASIVIPPITTGPVQFVKDAVDTTVEIDTATPVNNELLPVALYNLLGLMGTKDNTLGVSIFDTATGAKSIVDKNGSLKVGEAILMAGDVFGGVSPSANWWTFGGTGANITQPGNERIETGTGVNGNRQFQTIKRARFMGSQFNVYHAGINLPDILNPNVCFRMGAFNPIGLSNGAYFEVEGGVVPIWNLVTVKNGVATKVPQASWTGKGKDLFNATPNLAVYEIIYNAGTVAFFQGPNLLHTQAVNILGQTYANSYHFNVGLEIENINGNTTNNGIEVYAAVIYRLGEERGETIPRAYTTSQVIKPGAGYIGKASLSRSGSGGGAGTLQLYDGAILIGRLDVGGDDVKSITLDGTFLDGLSIVITGSGTNTATLNVE